MSMFLGALARRRIRRAVGMIPGLGLYAGPRYTPRFPLPDGVTYDPDLGWTIGYPTGVQVSYTPPMNEVLLTDQGSVAANRSLLQTTITNAGTDAVRIRLAPVTTNWGDVIQLNGYHVGVGCYLEDARVKDGTFPRAEGKRVQAADTGLAPFVVDANAWPSPGSNDDLRSAFVVGPSAGNVRFTGLRMTANPSWASLSAVSGGSVVRGLAGFVASLNGAGAYCDRVTIDRCQLVGPEEKRWRRGTNINGSRIAHINNLITNVHSGPGGGDSQCIASGEGGPSHLIENNLLECAFGENWMYGGSSDLYNPDGTPNMARVWTDLVVRRNVLSFPAAWVARGYQTKNLGEWKGGIRSLTERNIFRGYSLANGSIEGQFHAYVVKYSTGATRYNTTRLCRFESCHGFVLLESVRDWELAHLLHDTTGLPTLSTAALNSISVNGFSDYPTFPPNSVSDGRARGLKIHDVTTGNIPRANQINARWFDEGDTDGAREDWEVENNVAVLPDQPLDGTQDGYLWRSGQPLNAAANWARRTNTNSTWTGNVTAGPRASRAANVIPGDTAVETAAALNLSSTYRPNPGSPATGKGCDIDLLDAALVGVDTGL